MNNSFYKVMLNNVSLGWFFKFLFKFMYRHKLIFENISQAMCVMAEAEEKKKLAPREAGILVVNHLVTVSGRRTLIKEIAPLLKIYPKSNFLQAIFYICSSREGDYKTIGDELLSKIKPFQVEPTGSNAELNKKYDRFKMLVLSWRVVDQIARNQMGWASNNKDGYESFGFVHRVKLDGKGIEFLSFSFRELLLQNKDVDSYLNNCDEEFCLAHECLLSKIKIVREMIRSGCRRLSDYNEVYKFAQIRLDTLKPEWERLLWSNDFSKSGYSPSQILIIVDSLIILFKAFSKEKEVLLLVNRLVDLLNNSYFNDDKWAIAKFLAREKYHGDLPHNIIQSLGIPKNAKNIKSFFQWALYDRAFDKAEEVYKALPRVKRTYQSALDYVRILQRRGKFKEAEKLSRSIFVTHLSTPHKIDPFTCFSLMIRVGELHFAAKTSDFYKLIPQPQKLKGVMLITPRNIDQMRRLPIAVLQEMKKEGWAVIPLVDGVLPTQLTNDPKINILINAVSNDCCLNPKSINVFDPLNDFNLDIPNGHFNWGDIDLSHPLWEDASVNRRRYHIDFNCPLLKTYLGKLAEWTKLEAMAMQYAKKIMEENGLRFGVIGLTTGRLPDAMKRSYCEKYGDPETFFSLTTANGYQNYFSNFSTPLSEKCVIRNMTLHPHTRSASFPIPDLFEQYYNKNKKSSKQVLARVVEITKVKRSTGGRKELSQKTINAGEVVDSWRKNGGKVACAFGKVVCDSAVPFDGGPAHENMKDWINHCIRSVKGTNTLLLIKPHPHEINNQVATFPNEFFFDLIDEPINDNVLMLEHRSFDIYDLKNLIDFGLIYNGTTAIELGLLDIPCILAGHFAPIDYPVGHQVPSDVKHFEDLIKGEKPINVASDLKYKSALWLEYMSNSNMTLPYRYCSRPVTNKVNYPPTWSNPEMNDYLNVGDESVKILTSRALGCSEEPSL